MKHKKSSPYSTKYLLCSLWQVKNKIIRSLMPGKRICPKGVIASRVRQSHVNCVNAWPRESGDANPGRHGRATAGKSPSRETADFTRGHGMPIPTRAWRIARSSATGLTTKPRVCYKSAFRGNLESCKSALSTYEISLFRWPFCLRFPCSNTQP